MGLCSSAPILYTSCTYATSFEGGENTMQTTKFKVQSSNKNQPSEPRNFDLEERMGEFGEDVIELSKSITQDAITRPLISQIVRSATSIGANYCEANNSSSRKDFRNKVYISKKEAQETKHWLRMLKVAVPERATELQVLWQEVHEFVLILQSIANKVNEKGTN